MCSSWISDMLQEFVYQFQGFCQYRSLGNHRAEDVAVLEANRSVWDLAVVVKILRSLVTAGSSNTSNYNLVEFGKFAVVELARLECLTGDFAASLSTLSPTALSENMGSITRLPLANASIYYHAGVCHMMLRQYHACIDILSSYLLGAQALRPAEKKGSGNSEKSQVQKTQDRCLGLIGLAITLCPYGRIDEQVKEAVEAKYGEKMKRVATVDSGLRDLFEACCPKFICTTVPASFTSGENQNQITFDRIVSSFVESAKDSIQSLRLLKYLRLYSTIDISKLSKACGCAENDTVRYLEVIKANTAPVADSRTVCDGAKLLELNYQWQTNTRVDYALQGNTLRSCVASSKAIRGSSIQAFYVSSLKKHNDIAANITRAFDAHGL
jgi:translation initiation factor 3 subunit L